MRFQKWRVISKSVNSKSFGLTNIEIELEIQIQSIPAKGAFVLREWIGMEWI